MKRILFLVFALMIVSLPVFSQAKQDTAALGKAGDNFDLYAVTDLFLKSKTIEAFEKSLNEQKSGVNNLDLDLDKKVDFIKVVTKKDGDAYTFVLQDAVSKTETQDVAVILVNKDKKTGQVSVQVVGDEDLYGKDYVIEPKPGGSPSVTANPAYTGPEPVTKDVPASTTVVVQQAPIVQYVYSPAYVPYYPPYYYGYHPPYFAMATVLAVGIYRSNNWYHHGGYYGGHYGGGNNVIINNGNRNQINHYNNNRNTSNRVQHNNANGSYGNGNRGGSGNRPSNGASASTRPSNGASGANRPSNGASVSDRQSNGGGFSNGSNRQSTGGGRTRDAGGSSYGGGGSRGGGGGFSGGGRGGGGGGRRR